MLKANDGKQLEIEVESNKYCRMVDTNKNSGKKDYYNIKNLNPRIILVLRNENGEIRKNFLLFLYSIMVSIYLSLEYIFIKKFVINFDLSTSFFITYIVYLYIIYLMTYMTAFMFNSNQISIIVLILILALIIIYNINIFNIIDYLINKPIVLVFIIVKLNLFIIIFMNMYNKPLKKGSD